MVFKKGISGKEVKEAYRAGIPSVLIDLMRRGEYYPDELSTLMINTRGKEYVKGHRRNGKWVRPQLRDRPEGKLKLILTASQLENARWYLRVSNEIIIKVAKGIPLTDKERKIATDKWSKSMVDSGVVNLLK